jgi:hypothetical protein
MPPVTALPQADNLGIFAKRRAGQSVGELEVHADSQEARYYARIVREVGSAIGQLYINNSLLTPVPPQLLRAMWAMPKEQVEYVCLTASCTQLKVIDSADFSERPPPANDPNYVPNGEFESFKNGRKVIVQGPDGVLYEQLSPTKTKNSISVIFLVEVEGFNMDRDDLVLGTWPFLFPPCHPVSDSHFSAFCLMWSPPSPVCRRWR